MNVIKGNVNLISYCGLYCGNCSKYKKGKCKGCKQNNKATWCKIRTCNIKNSYNSCADCKDPGSINCKKFNNPIAKVFGYIFNSDRNASIQLIEEKGYSFFANEMVDSGKMAISRRRK